MPKVKIRFLSKPSCTTGRKARGLLLELGAEPESRDLSTERLTEAELEALVGQRDYEEFLNPCNELDRTQNSKERPPSRGEAIGAAGQTAQSDWQDGGDSPLANGSGF